MSYYYIIGIRINHRVKNAAKIQEILTKHGCAIKARIGLHESGEDFCADDGLIILQVGGTASELEAIVADLDAVSGVTAKLLDLNADQIN